MKRSLLVILGDQLFEDRYLPKGLPIFMAEDHNLCSKYRYHQQKLVLVLSSMRHHAEQLRSKGRDVLYHRLDTPEEGELPYLERLKRTVALLDAKRIVTFEIEGKGFEEAFGDFCRKENLEWDILPSPMFLTSRTQFEGYLEDVKKPFMKTFYERQRKHHEILVDSKGKPLGGKWSLDSENRKKLPNEVDPPTLKWVEPDEITQEVMDWVGKNYGENPGSAHEFAWPTTHMEAKRWLTRFLKERLRDFGDYEDALPQRSASVFHSLLTPMMNIGLLTPEEVLDKALEYGRTKKIPLNSLEGFVRQILGWREFIRGIYRNYSQQQEETNFFGHHRKLTDAWYTGDTGLPPLDIAIRRAKRVGYNHHIERLMVISNTMLLCRVDPKEAHRWFMEMYVDSAEWVMGPNVYGMGQFSDGGIFATKPYICGSNYWLKMSDYPKGEWQDGIDGLYWAFIDRNRAYFAKNPRMATMVRMHDQMPSAKAKRLLLAARDLQARLTKA